MVDRFEMQFTCNLCGERNEHSITLNLPPDCENFCVGVCNYSAHKRETCYYTLSTSLHVAPPSVVRKR